MIDNRKIFDCIPFYQSNLLFELRFKTLDKIVDKFVVCEATKTHSGLKKELNFDINKFSKLTNKIKYIVVDDMPDFLHNSNDKYPFYNFQINKLHEGLSDAKDEDLIIVSDEDEIPNPNVIKKFNYTIFKYGIFLQNLYYYKFNIYNETENNGNNWPGSRICLRKNLKKFSDFRALKVKNKYSPFWKIWKEKSIDLINDGGWHFTYLMTYEKIAEKIKSSEHSEYNKNEFTDIKKIKYRVENLIDPFDRKFNLRKIKIDDTFPNELFRNQDKYKKWIVE